MSSLAPLLPPVKFVLASFVSNVICWGLKHLAPSSLSAFRLVLSVFYFKGYAQPAAAQICPQNDPWMTPTRSQNDVKIVQKRSGIV